MSTDIQAQVSDSPASNVGDSFQPPLLFTKTQASAALSMLWVSRNRLLFFARWRILLLLRARARSNGKSQSEGQFADGELGTRRFGAVRGRQAFPQAVQPRHEVSRI